MKSQSSAIGVGFKLALITAIILCSAVAGAMDWDTASEVATCRNHRGYETLGVRATDLLREHKIHSMLMYFAKPDKNGTEALTTDSKQAGRWGLYVNVRDAPQARRLVSSAIKDGLLVTLSMKDPDPTPKVGAIPK